MNHQYNINEKELHRMNIKLLYITSAKYGEDWHSLKHAHHFTELFYVIRGKGEFVVENHSFPVKDDDLIVVNPNVSHTEISSPSAPLEYIALGINGLQFLSEESEEAHDYSVHNYQEYKHEILFYLKTLLIEAQNNDEYCETICQDLLEILIMNMLRRIKKRILIAPTKKITKECRFIEQYINEHYAEEIDLDLLSKLTYLNKFYLVHAFKGYKGISPINYLIDIRIASAKQMLENTNYSVSKISGMVGFSSQSYFSQAFKKESGMTPNQYRKVLKTS